MPFKYKHAAGTTDGTIERLERKIELLKMEVKRLKQDVGFAYSAGKVRGIRQSLRG